MSDAVHIEFDRRDRVYRPGEIVSGTVVVSGVAGRRSLRVVLRSWWGTSGRGTKVRGGKRSVVLHEGPPAPGAVQSHPFRFTAPDWPFTYRGHHLAIDHELKAVVEIPLAPDVEGEESFVLIPGSVTPEVPDALETLPSETPGPKPDRRAGVIGLVLLGIGVITLPAPGVYLLIAGAVFLGFGLRNKFAASRTGRVTVEVEPRVAAPGDEVVVAVRIHPPEPLQLAGITASLRAREICVSGSGNNRRTHKHVAHLEEKALLGPERLAGELVRDVVGSFVVPALGMWSFKAHNNEVRWEIDVQIRIPSWPDWQASVPIVVWPAKALPEPISAAVELAPPSTGQQMAANPGRDAGRRAELRLAETAARRIEDRMARLRPRAPTTPQRPPAQRPPPAEGVPPPARPRPAPVSPVVTEPAATKPARSKPVAPALTESAASEGVAPRASKARDEVDLASAIRSILDTRSHSAERRAQVAALTGRRVDVVVVVERIDRPFGRTRTPGFEDGRVIQGGLVDSGLNIEVRVPTSRVGLAEGLNRGDTLVVSGEVASWERLPERPVICVSGNAG